MSTTVDSAAAPRRGPAVTLAITTGALLALATAACTVDATPRLRPFAQPKFELTVGASVDVPVILSVRPESTQWVDVDSAFDGIRYEPEALVYEPGATVRSVRLTATRSTRGSFSAILFSLRGTDNTNSLLVLVSNRIAFDGGAGAVDSGSDAVVYDSAPPDSGGPSDTTPPADSGADAAAPVDSGAPGDSGGNDA